VVSPISQIGALAPSAPDLNQGRDLAKRREVDQVVHGLRVQIAEAAGKLADEAGEPPLDDAA